MSDGFWIAVSVPVHPKGVQLSSVPGFVQASQVLSHKTHSII